jgi:formylglycine-generating enzyme required for sulfatase activity
MGSYALLVGIGEFKDPRLAKLNAPRSDVEEFARVLQDSARGGFDQVTTCIDQDFQTIRERLDALLEGRDPEDMVLLYYSGHGIIAKGQRLYLATGQSSFDRPAALSLSALEMRDWLKLSRAGKQVIILDCCHSGAFVEGAKGNAQPVTGDTFGSDNAVGQYVLTATDSLQFAYDANGTLREGAAPAALSRFTGWLVDAIGKGEAAPDSDRITLDQVFDYLSRRARTEAADMTPERFVSSNSGEMIIARNPSAKPPALAQELLAQLSSADWRVRKDAVAELGKLARQPRMRTLVKTEVRNRAPDERDREVSDAMYELLAELGGARAPDQPLGVEQGPSSVAPGAATGLQIAKQGYLDLARLWLRAKWALLGVLVLAAIGGAYTFVRLPRGAEFKDCAECPTMVRVPAGSFTMGSPESEEGRQDTEGPQHPVIIRRAFAVGKYEVTFAEWDACVADGGCNGYRPDDEGRGRGNRPAMNVGWNDAHSYVTWLKDKTGKEYRLLSESEWEYAARAGTTTPYYWGETANGAYAKYASEDGAAVVGSYSPNGFGLYDMLGNVSEWTEDCYNPDYIGAPGDNNPWTSGECGQHVVRGGFWGDAAKALRSADRPWSSSPSRANYIGFRVARTL